MEERITFKEKLKLWKKEADERREEKEREALQQEIDGNTLPHQTLYFDYKSVNPLLNKMVVDKYGYKMKSNYVLKNKEVIALYFSSSYCVKCVQVLPILKEIHKRAEEMARRFEIIYVSYDVSKTEMMSHFRRYHGNWFGLDYDEPFRQLVKYMYGILSIPHLIVLNSTGGMITMSGLHEIETIGVNVLVTWF